MLNGCSSRCEFACGRFSHPGVTTNFGAGLSHQEPSPSRLSLLLFSSFIVVFTILRLFVFVFFPPRCQSQLESQAVPSRPINRLEPDLNAEAFFLSLCLCVSKVQESPVQRRKIIKHLYIRLTDFHFPQPTI